MIKNFFKLTLFTCLISLCSCNEEETNRVIVDVEAMTVAIHKL